MDELNDDRAKFRFYLECKRLKLDRCVWFRLKRDEQVFFQSSNSEKLFSESEFRAVVETLNIRPVIMPEQRPER